MAKRTNKRWSIRTNWMLYAMLVPGIALVVTFNYMPLYGLVIAFQDYNPLHGFLGSPFVGMKWFRYLLDMPDFPVILRNTLSIAGSKIIIGTVVSILFALFLNEVRGIHFKKIVQTVSYMPYFLSWVILGGIFVDILSMNGVVNRMLGGLGISTIPFLSSNAWFPFTIVSTATWQSFGWGSILYIAAIASIDTSLYEYTYMEGAGRLKQMWYVTLPGILPTIALLALLSLGNILNAGFEQIFMMYNPVVYASGDIIDTFVYRTGLIGAQFSLATAVGLFKSVISCLLIVVSYFLADRYVGYRII